MSKTEPTFRETKLWVLPIEMIENIIFDNIILVKSYIFENYNNLDFNIDTLFLLHKMLCENIYNDAWIHRRHNVTIWSFEPIDFFKVPIELKNLEEDILERQKYIKSMQDKKEFLAYVMWKILWIHPFFDYNGRVTRLFWELFLLKNNMNLTTFEWTSRNNFISAMKKATDEYIFDDIIKLF